MAILQEKMAKFHTHKKHLRYLNKTSTFILSLTALLAGNPRNLLNTASGAEVFLPEN
jgi:hypothetical protein